MLPLERRLSFAFVVSRDFAMRSCIYLLLLLGLLAPWELEAQSTNSLILNLTVLPAQGATVPRIAVDLCNRSVKEQRIGAYLTNSFPGELVLRQKGHPDRHFVETNYWKLLMGSYRLPTTLHLAPGACHRFEGSLDRFMDHEHPRPFAPKKLPASVGDRPYPILSQEVRPPCELVAQMRVYQQIQNSSGYVTYSEISLASEPFSLK